MNVSDIMTKENIVTFPISAKVTDAFAKMKETGIHQVPVVSGSRYIGMLLFREILKRRSLQSMEKIGSLVMKTPALRPDAGIIHAVEMIRKSGIPALPVVEKGKLIGIVSRSDLMRNLSSFGSVGSLKVLDVMTANPETVHPDDNIHEALEKMRNLDESEIPVVDHSDALKGLIMLRSISSSAIIRGEAVKGKADIIDDSAKTDLKCSSLMSNPVYVGPDTDLAEASRVLLKNRFHSVPVCDSQGKIAGVVGVMDILNMIEVTPRDKGILIQVSGLGAYDDDLYDILFFEGGKFVSRISRIAGIDHGSFNVHVTKYHSSGRTKYSLRTRLYGGRVHMSVDDFDWNFGKCVARIFETYENRLKKDR